MITRHISGIVKQNFDLNGKLVSQTFIPDDSNESHQFWFDKNNQLIDPEDYFDEAPEVDPNQAEKMKLHEVLDTAQDHGADLKPLLHGLFETYGNKGIVDYLAKMGKRVIGSDPVMQECRETGSKACNLGWTPHIDGVCSVCEIRDFYTEGYLREKDAAV